MRFPRDVPRLGDGVVTLRAHRLDDVDAVVEQCRDPLSIRWTTVPLGYTRDDARRFVTEAMPGGWETDQEWGFAVEALDGDRPRFGGTVALRDRGERRAEVAYGAHPWVRGRGLMERALRLLLDWGFAEKDLLTVVWWANRGNWASRRLAWRLGFGIEGGPRGWLPQRGELMDAWVGSLLRDDTREPRSEWLDVPRILGTKVVLRPYRDDDVPRMVEGCADARTRYWLTQMPDPFTEDDARGFIEGRVEQRAKGEGVTWAVADPETDELVGNLAMFDRWRGEAELGYWTHPGARGRGVMTEACGLAVRHAFVPVEDGGLGLRRLRVMAAEGNTASVRVVEANGFIRVGRSRRRIPLGDDTYTDGLLYDLLAEEHRDGGCAERSEAG
jgi:RimJ/RimL family protein N-acetyltransferase